MCEPQGRQGAARRVTNWSRIRRAGGHRPHGPVTAHGSRGTVRVHTGAHGGVIHGYGSAGSYVYGGSFPACASRARPTQIEFSTRVARLPTPNLHPTYSSRPWSPAVRPRFARHAIRQFTFTQNSKDKSRCTCSLAHFAAPAPLFPRWVGAAKGATAARDG